MIALPIPIAILASASFVSYFGKFSHCLTINSIKIRRINTGTAHAITGSVSNMLKLIFNNMNPFLRYTKLVYYCKRSFKLNENLCKSASFGKFASMLKKRIIALFFSFIFVFGSIGFSFTIHTCSHSGISYFSTLNTLEHPCEEGPKNMISESCCSEKSEKSCCSEQSSSDDSLDSGKSPSCCKDESKYYKLENAFFNLSVKKVIPFFTQTFINYTFEAPLKSGFFKFYDLIFPQRFSHLDSLSILCVFRI